MSLLTSPLPQSVAIGGQDYAINTDFRVGIQFEGLLSRQMGESERILEMLRLYYPVIPPDPVEAIRQILWFYRCGKGDRDSKDSGDPAYSFDQDDGYIYSAFLDQYGVDLSDITYLHWWKFRSMFQSLKEDCEIMKIMGYRTIKITGSMSAEQRSFYKKMKKIHEIKSARSGTKMTTEQYHQSMIDYVRKRFEESRKKG